MTESEPIASVGAELPQLGDTTGGCAAFREQDASVGSLGCCWRETAGPDAHLCRSPKYVAPPNRVELDFCRTCVYRDHPASSEPAVPPPDPVPTPTPELRFADEFGPLVLPDDGYAKPTIYAEVCEQDAYGFRRLHAEGFRVRTAVDLGASYGVASRMIRHFWPHARIIAFEPDPTRFGYLAGNCPSVECRDYGVAGFATDLPRLLEGIGADPGGKWRPDPRMALHPPFDNPRTVAEAFTDLDHIDLLKIDVEGFELGIMRELAEMGLLARVRRIVGEWHFDNARLGLQEVLTPTHSFECLSRSSNPWDLFWACRDEQG